MNDKFEKHITIQIEQPVLNCLSENTSLSHQQLKRVMQNGSVWLENAQGVNRIRRAKKIVKTGDIVHLYYDKKIQQGDCPNAKLIADEGEFSVWHKPSGMLSQGSKWGDDCTLYRYSEKHLKPERSAFTVHRLDRAANGLMLLAHSKKVARLFSEMFENRRINKKYVAVVEGLVPAWDLPYKIVLPVDGKDSISYIVSREVNLDAGLTSLVIDIETGRKHQIRKHLSGLGFPIRGDRLYGAKDLSVDLQLTSSKLEFVCPVSGELKIFEV